MAESLDKRLQMADVYAQALFELAQQSGQVDLVRSELEELVELGRIDPMLGEFFRSEALDSDRRAELMEKWFRGKLSDLTLNAMLVANTNGRNGLGDALLHCFRLRQEAAAGQIQVTAVTAVALDDAMKQEVTQLAARLSGKKPLVTFNVDAALLGGLVLQIGDLRYDNSLRRHLHVAAGRLSDRSERGLEVAVA